MPVTVKCERCGKQYAAPESLAGKSVRCRQCGNIVPVPSAGLLDVKPLADGVPIIDPTPPPSARLPAAPAKPAVPVELPAPAPHRPQVAVAAPPISHPQPLQRPAPAKPTPPPDEEEAELGEDDIHDDDDESPDTGPAASLERSLQLSAHLPANGLFDFPGSGAVDQLMPWVIIVGGTAWIIHDSVRSSPGDHPGLGYLRAFVYLLTYTMIIFPLTYTATRSAVRVKRFGLPPAGMGRVFAAFFPTLVFGTVLWLVAGSVASLVAGIFIGLIPGLGALWLLLRLQPYQGGRVLAASTIGFVAGAVLAIAILLGVNYCLVAGYHSTEHSYQESPLGPGFHWEKPPEKPTPPKADPEVLVRAPLPTSQESTTEPTTKPSPWIEWFWRKAGG